MEEVSMAARPKPKMELGAKPPEKDVWDKVDIVGRALIPVIVALSVLFWNSERTARDTAAQMITIATSILTTPPDQSAPSALRSWAIEVLRFPENPPTLTDEAATALKTEFIPLLTDGLSEKFKRINDALDGIEKELPTEP